MWVAGFTLNFLTLLALALAVGIVIDDAIVGAREHRPLERRKGIQALSRCGAGYPRNWLSGPLDNTIADGGIRFPIAFMSGMSGRFLRSFGLTMAFAVGVSMLITSFSLTPSLAAR